MYCSAYNGQIPIISQYTFIMEIMSHNVLIVLQPELQYSLG